MTTPAKQFSLGQMMRYSSAFAVSVGLAVLFSMRYKPEFTITPSIFSLIALVVGWVATSQLWKVVLKEGATKKDKRNALIGFFIFAVVANVIAFVMAMGGVPSGKKLEMAIGMTAGVCAIVFVLSMTVPIFRFLEADSAKSESGKSGEE